MRAVVLEKLNSPLAVHEVFPDEVGRGQVLVRVVMAGICGAQIQEIKGYKGNEKFLPHLLGHEGVGVVDQVGEGVLFVKPGQRVIMHWRPGVGLESDFPKYILNGKRISSGKVTTFSEFSLVSENRLTPIGDKIPDEWAVLLGCGLSTALATVENECQLKFGERVLVVGAGGVGLSLIQALRLRGCGEITSLDSNSKKKSLALNSGANRFVENLEHADNFDLILDTSGNSEVISRLHLHCKGGGRVVMIGQPQPDSIINLEHPLQFFHGSGISLRATQGGGVFPTHDFPRYLELLRYSDFDSTKVVTHVYPLESVNIAIRTLLEGQAGRVLLKNED